jgi:glycosyltransferase involved in cell wall biosynthesis
MPSRHDGRISVLFALHSLIGGGAERVVVHLVNGLDRERFAPVLALGRAEGPYLGDVRADVPLHVLGADRARTAAPALLRAVWRVRPDVVVATAGLNLAVAIARRAFPPRTRVVLREANSPSAFLADVARTSRARAALYRAAYRLLYREADVIVCQSDAMLADLASRRVPRTKLRRIHNPVDVARVQALAREPDAGSPSALVSVGRLSRQKGYDVLLEALVAVRARRPSATLRIFGDGDERERLEAATRRLGLDGAVDLPGFSANPYAAVAAADLFVSSSRYEGFSNAIVEALACGTPVVATDCPSANREVIAQGADGWVAAPPEEPQALADAILRALDEQPRLDRDAIRRRCAERFSAPRVIAAYAELLSDLAARPPRTIRRR